MYLIGQFGTAEDIDLIERIAQEKKPLLEHGVSTARELLRSKFPSP